MSYVSVDMSTGQRLEGLAHLKASIRDVLTTPVGTRVMRRDYGSNLFELIDRPINALTLTQIYAATAAALQKWEPRLKVTRVQAAPLPSEISQGRISIDLEGEYLPEGREVLLEGIVV